MNPETKPDLTKEPKYYIEQLIKLYPLIRQSLAYHKVDLYCSSQLPDAYKIVCDHIEFAQLQCSCVTEASKKVCEEYCNVPTSLSLSILKSLHESMQ
jgi:hypothetical protein